MRSSSTERPLGRDLAMALLAASMFLVASYLLIGSSYEFAAGDAGTYALKTRWLVQEHHLELGGQASLAIGQVLIGSLFASLLGFSLWSLHVSAYATVGGSIVLFYALLVRAGIDRRLALFGAFSLFVNPIGLGFVDWYLTEPYFFLFLLAALNAYAAAFERGSNGYLAVAALLSTVAVFTKQFGVFLPLAAGALLLSHGQRVRCSRLALAASAAVPLLALAAFYTFGSVKGDYAMQAMHFERMRDPLQVPATLLEDAIVTLDYMTLYALPIYLLALIAAVAGGRMRGLFFGEAPAATGVAFATLLSWTIRRYATDGGLMPYKPSVFDAGRLASLWGVPLSSESSVSIGLTVACVAGSTLLLSRILAALVRRGPRGEASADDAKPAASLLRALLWWCGILSFVVISAAGMFYERHAFPVAIFAIAFLLWSFPWMARFRATGLLILLVVYAAFGFDIKRHRIADEALWRAANGVLASGVKPLEINAGMGFNLYYSFPQIETIYEGLGFLDWYKMHPMAEYFLYTGEAEGQLKGLDLVRVETDDTRWPAFRPSIYVFRRAADFDGPILPKKIRRHLEETRMTEPFAERARSRMRKLEGSSTSASP